MKPEKPAGYLVALAAFIALGFVTIWQVNVRLAPEMYSPTGVAKIAETLSKGENYAVFDLNINIRQLRDEQLARMTTTPDVIVLGASHWQEAHTSLIPHKNFFNAHVHRDYFEDLLGVTEMLVRHNRLPKQMIIAIRDDLFTPLEARTDHLWLPGIPYYNTMAKQLGVQPLSAWESLPIKRWRELASLPMLHSNAVRWGNAADDQTPRPTVKAELEALDILLPGGSIVWSREHQAIFTPERAHRLSVDSAKLRLNKPPQIDPKGVDAIDTLLAFLKSKNVEVFLAKPPFNPDYYDRVMKGSYSDGLRRIETIIENYATKYGWQVIGSFNPHDLGCKSRMYIDSDHANPECLAKLLNQFNVYDKAKSGLQVASAPAPDTINDVLRGLPPALEPSFAPSAASVPFVITPAPFQSVDHAANAEHDTTGSKSMAPAITRRVPAAKAQRVIVAQAPKEKASIANIAPKTAAVEIRHTSKSSGNATRTDHYSITSRKSEPAIIPVVHQQRALIWPGDQYHPDRIPAARVHRIGYTQSR